MEERPASEAAVREEAVRLNLNAELELDPATATFASLDAQLAQYIAKIDREHMPLGRHVLGVPPNGETGAFVGTAGVKKLPACGTFPPLGGIHSRTCGLSD